MLDEARNTKLAAGAPATLPAPRASSLKEVPATLDRSKGDIHAAGNPHYVVDPANAKIVARNITEAFCALDEKSAAAYRANLKKFTDALDAKLVEWQKTTRRRSRASRSSPTTTRGFTSATASACNIDLFLEPKPGVPPTPRHLAEVIVKMKLDKVHVILVDPYLDRRTAETVAGKTGATVVDVAQFPGGVKGTEGGYIALLDYLVNSVAKALAARKQSTNPQSTTPPWNSSP